MSRRSLGWPITLGIVMIVLVLVLILGWVLLAVVAVIAPNQSAGFYITFLVVGTTFLLLVLAGVVSYLALSIKAINLSRRQSNFIDSVTHELKSPISSLKLYLQTLNRRNVTETQRTDFYRFMLEDVERLDDLFNHLLDAARLEKGSDAGEAEDVELAGLIGQCAETVCLRYRVGAEAIRLDLAPCTVRAVRGDVEIIFCNLIDNAIKYGGPDPLVEISLSAEPDGFVVARIRDNGPGIPPQSRRKIFRRFVRLGMELQRKKPGTGLGLYIVRTFVRRLRGTIRVSDRREGTGTAFEVRLPGNAAKANLQTPAPS